MNKISEIAAGKILVADPFMGDPNFRRAVIVLCEHSVETGSVGFVLNRPLKMGVSDLVKGFPQFQSEVYFGGPVATDTIHFIHNTGNLIDNSVEVARGVYWGGDFEKLKFLIEANLIKPKHIRFFVGYSGWSTGQLSEEMDRKSWIGSDLDANYIFKSNPNRLWKKAMNDMGDHFTVIAQIPEFVSLN